ncbi:MAG TPA: tryptophan synthase subunit alpha [Ktedonobacterales bacterium]|nr:tryptophan synthase subunit alpha [Ktedonobacterales bacterium]
MPTPTTIPAERIAGAFARAREQGRVALIPYVMAGYPDEATSEELAVALAEAGADVLELGVPFSDPLADGATIQHASHLALQNGMSLGGALALAGRVTPRTAMPLVMMTYYNPIFRFGLEEFAQAARTAGLAGVIVPDLPPEESAALQSSLAAHGIALIFLATPTSPDERLARIAEAAEASGGFVYCVSLSGVTGARDRLPDYLRDFVARVRAQSDLPLAVGFGVSRPDHVTEIGRIADGAVVASALLNAVDAAPPAERVPAAVAFLRALQSGAHLETAAE